MGRKKKYIDVRFFHRALQLLLLYKLLMLFKTLHLTAVMTI